MKAILIDAARQEVREIEISDWRDITKAIGWDCRLFTVATELENGDSLFVDDEGLINGTEHFFITEYYPHPLAGNGVILGCNEDGESQNCKSTIDEIKVGFTSREHIINAMAP